MSIGAFAALAHDELDRLVAARGAAVVSGGTGLYLRAALADLDVPRPWRWRIARIAREVDDDRIAAHERLAGLDPAAAAVVHRNDRKRLVRALELAEAGTSLVAGRDRLWRGGTRRPTLVAVLDVPADVLERRIRERAEAMFARGVVDEVRAAHSRVPSRAPPRRRSGSPRSPSWGPRRARAARRAHGGGTPPTSANGCDASPISSLRRRPAPDEVAEEIVARVRDTRRP